MLDSTPHGTSGTTGTARFRTGLIVGIAIGLLVIVPLGIVGATMAFTRLMAWELSDVDPGTSLAVQKVAVDKPWLAADAAGRGTLTGWADGTGSDWSPGAGLLGSFEVKQATEQQGVTAGVSVNVWLTENTKLLRGGLPWKPSADRLKGRTPAEYLASTFTTYDPDDYVDFRDVTVKYHIQRGRLIADSIDSSLYEANPPDELW